MFVLSNVFGFLMYDLSCYCVLIVKFDSIAGLVKCCFDCGWGIGLLLGFAFVIELC